MNTRVVYKYPLTEAVNGVQTFRGARFLHADNQRERITVWAEVDERADPCVRVLFVVGTGDEVPNFGEYLGTVLVDDGAFVFHIYVQPEEPA